MAYRHTEDLMFAIGCALIKRTDSRRKKLNKHFRRTLVTNGSSRNMKAKMRSAVALLVLRRIEDNGWDLPVYESLEKSTPELFSAVDALLDLFEMFVVVYGRIVLNDANRDKLNTFIASVGLNSHTDIIGEPASPLSTFVSGTPRSIGNMLTPQTIPQIGDIPDPAKCDDSAIALMPTPTIVPASTLTIPTASSLPVDHTPVERCKEATSPTTEIQLHNSKSVSDKRSLAEDANSGPSAKRMRIGSQSLQLTLCTDHYSDGTSSQKIILNTQSTD